METSGADERRLDVLKALGDDTRYAIYTELASSGSALSTAEVAERLGLHVNTVRPHLERMREVGLLEVSTASTGHVGRPQHRYRRVAGAPGFGIEPPALPTLARALLQLADDIGAGAANAYAAGEVEGGRRADTEAGPDGPEGLIAHLEASGFEPRIVEDGDTITVSFGRCPFDEMAADNPALVCGMHEGMVHGFVDHRGGCEINAFHPRDADHDCEVRLVRAPGNIEPPQPG